jgi:probable F420-dependent oxidoreductase
MHLGLVIFATDYAIPIDELARAAEERGFESLFLTEHTHIPASRQSPYAGGGELPAEYGHTLDPFVALAAAAMVTRRLRLGTGVCLVTERDPIVTAKEVASLDMVSGGRFLFGVGAGWNREEMADHGTAFEDRFKVMQDRVLAMTQIWTHEVASYSGPYVRFDPMWSYPKPVQKPRPPVLWGGESVHTLRRAAELGDGWFPRARRTDVAAGLARLRELAGRAGRSLDGLDVTVYGAAPDAGELERLAEAGATRALLVLPSKGRDDVLPLLDRHAPLAQRFGRTSA